MSSHLKVNKQPDAAKYVFGYGSLVNSETHQLTMLSRVTVRGWQRQWSHCVETPRGKICALTVVPAAGCTVEGVVLAVDDTSLRGLDEREIGYDRITLAGVEGNGCADSNVEVYVSRPVCYHAASPDYPIRLSYVNVVAVGYLRMGGLASLREFIASTSGWNMPVLDDTAKPRYPRQIHLSAQELQQVRSALSDARIGLDTVQTDCHEV